MTRNVALTVLVLVVAAMAVTGCGEPPSAKTCYKLAYQTAKEQGGLPPDARIAPRGEALIQVAKNAARVEIPYDYSDEAGNTVRDVYVVWLKRLKRRWEPDRYYRKPKYTTPAVHPTPSTD